MTLATALLEIGYTIEVYSLKDGPAHTIWKEIGVSVSIITISHKDVPVVDWLNYDGILLNSLEAKDVFSCFMQEPLNSIPLIWTVHEAALAIRSKQYASAWQIDLLNDWKNLFNRATVVVFPTYALPMIYSAFDAGNYYVIPGSPAKAWEAESMMAFYKDDLRAKMGYGTDGFVIAVVGSEFLYRGLWLEHALVLQSLSPLCAVDNLNSNLKILILSGHSTNNYSAAVEAIALKLKYPRGAVKHISTDGDAEGVLSIADIVVYGSFLEEKSFPQILVKAMCFGKLVIAPDLSMIKKYVDDRVNGYLFPKENIKVLPQIILRATSKGKLSPLSSNVASLARETAKNLMVSETIDGYALLLQKVLKLPSEVSCPKEVSEIPSKYKKEWSWHLVKDFLNSTYENKSLRSYRFLEKVEEQWNNTQKVSSDFTNATDDSYLFDFWAEERYSEMVDSRRRREEEELKDRTEQPHEKWEDLYRKAKRAGLLRDQLHERDVGELERAGQPLCIYEPYFGEGTWPFLHLNSLYRGIGLSSEGRRQWTDDIDAPSRLLLLNNPYYRDTLGEYGAFFAIANRVDQIHKHAWIGFQSWRTTARQASLSRIAEKSLLDSIESGSLGDTLYFWVRMDMDPRNRLRQDFWSFCDVINAGNCKFAFSETLKKMYGFKKDLDSLPSMPEDGDTWSVMHSWVLPTRSFLEFVMFSRMFVDALDAQMYDDHYQTGRCYLSLSKDKHCYSRLLELLINVWAYHSARGMVYINPVTGMMQEQHTVNNRRGKMWIQWFTYSTLKSMDEDLAEEADSDHPRRRWLWPSTGEVVWQGVLEREKEQRALQKERRNQRRKERISRMKARRKYPVIGRYVKPPPLEDKENLNSTMDTISPPLEDKENSNSTMDTISPPLEDMENSNPTMDTIKATK
ncbi:hypothetical protein HS088_TW18G00450 [Tripterygium wilfordii]|uniref:Glycosyl transferase family 1 domain-containing protein n=2 Tax=Tripterygium wilfordii TaxID=458696 RepID=A0A7J7CCV1_TRIWF|nr:hypothetical protein HS088_TW18G00450 [Tripterygium wilfordii]